jgi:hypothetical protein
MLQWLKTACWPMRGSAMSSLKAAAGRPLRRHLAHLFRLVDATTIER